MLENYLNKIIEVYPEISITTANFNDNGQNNRVIEVNNALIFRFPKYQKGIIKLQEETRLLEYIRKFITFEIPRPVYCNFEPMVVGEVFVGYKMIPGIPFYKNLFIAINDHDKLLAIANQLSNFLRELHGIPLQSEFTDSCDSNDTQFTHWQGIYKRIKERLYHYMSLKSQKQVTKHFEDFLSNASNFHYEPTYVYGDLGASNILIDPFISRITGIIDFGGAHIGDPAIDVAGILGDYGESFLRLFYETYPEIESLLLRAKFYVGTFALQEALFGIENNDEQAFMNGIQNYR